MANKDDICEVSLKRLAKKLGVSARTGQIWMRSLEEEGWVERLHKGDKAIGLFRVIRNEAERPAVRVRNAPKLAARRAVKTGQSESMFAPRCESDFAQYKSHQDLERRAEFQRAGRRPNGEQTRARQGKQHINQTTNLHALHGGRRVDGNHPDWNAWASRLMAKHGWSAEQSWTWLMKEIDRIQTERSLAHEEAGLVVHRDLQIWWRNVK